MDVEHLQEFTDRWSESLASWALPSRVTEGADGSPWFCDVARYTVDGLTARDEVGIRLAREVLPAADASVLDVGCGGGRASIPLAPGVGRFVGVDTRPEMLAAYTLAAADVGASATTIGGVWPDVAPDTPVCDVAVSQHVVYNVADIVPFVLALTDRARLGVVVVLPDHHPMTVYAPAWKHFWHLDRPSQPTADLFVEIVRLLDLDPEIERFTPTQPPLVVDDTYVEAVRRRLCLPPERSEELAAWLQEHPIGYPPSYTALRWPGSGGR